MYANLLTQKKASTSGFAARRLVRLASGKTYVEYSTTQTIPRSGLLGLVKSAAAKYASIKAEQVEVTMRCIGGGGGGAWGGAGRYGGLPGAVATRTVCLADIQDNTLSLIIGAGGSPGNFGGNTSIALPSGSEIMRAWGGPLGGNTDAEEQQRYALAALRGGILVPNPVLFSSTDFSLAPSSPDGPGGGGHQNAAKPLTGGTSSYNNQSSMVDGATVDGADGSNATDAYDDGFNSYGSGGAGSRAGAGGNGGLPGGGGGGSYISNPTKGYGGNGAIRFQFHVYEI